MCRTIAELSHFKAKPDEEKILLAELTVHR